LGIERIEQLEQLDRDSLIARLGEELITRLDQAMGRRSERLHPLEPASEIKAEWNLEYPLSRSAAVLEIVDQLLQSAIDQLPPGWGIVQFDITLRHEAIKESSRLPIGLSRPSAEIAHLLGLLKLALDRTKLLAPVTGLLLHVTRTAPFELFQPTLFETEATADRREWDGLIDRLSSRLGRDQVVTSFFVPDAQPERACEYQPALVAKRRHRDEAVLAMRRPIRLLTFPKRIQVHVAHPSGMPTAYQEGHGVQSITHAWGPERIETSWWRGQPIGRDYFQIELDDGSRLWIFRDLVTRQWFLHGAFD
jgi:protein ImuB